MVTMKKKILIIEDNELNMKLVRSLLQLNSIETIEAYDAEKGIELVGTCKPNLILMDIQLPGIDGLEATRRIISNPDLKGIPIIALTSYAMEGDEDQALAAGCTGYITKPIDTKKFVKIINKYLQ